MQQRQEAYDLLRSAAADPQRGVLLTHKKILADTRLRGSGKLLVMLLDSLAIKFGRRVLDISTPKLGELIGESSQAVANLLRRLEGLGYLTVIDKPSRGQTAGWQVEVFDPELPGLVGKRDPQPELFEEAAEQEEIEQQEDPQVIKLAQLAEEATERLVQPPASAEAEQVLQDVRDQLLGWGFQSSDAEAVARLLAEECRQRAGEGRPRPWSDKWEEVLRIVRTNKPHTPGPYVRACLRKRQFPVK